MKKIIFIKINSFFILVTFFISAHFHGIAAAMPVGSLATSSGHTSAQLSQMSDSAGPVQSFQPDLFTGRAQTSVPTFVPPGMDSTTWKCVHVDLLRNSLFWCFKGRVGTYIRDQRSYDQVRGHHITVRHLKPSRILPIIK